MDRRLTPIRLDLDQRLATLSALNLPSEAVATLNPNDTILCRSHPGAVSKAWHGDQLPNDDITFVVVRFT